MADIDILYLIQALEDNIEQQKEVIQALRILHNAPAVSPSLPPIVVVGKEGRC